MKILNLDIQNFRSHRRTVLTDLPAIAFFVGQNASGKSSIIDAVCYLFKGTCRGMDDRGAGAETMVSSGPDGKPVAARFLISAVTDRGTVVRSGPGQGPMSQYQKQADAVLLHAAKPVDMRLLCETQRFLELPVAEQKTALQRLLTMALPPGQIEQAIGDDFQYLVNLRFDWTMGSTLDAAERYCRERRRVLRGVIDQMVAPDLTVYPESLRTLTAAAAQAVVLDGETKLAGLRQERRRLAVDVAALEATANVAANALAVIAKEVESAKALPQLSDDLQKKRAGVAAALQEAEVEAEKQRVRLRATEPLEAELTALRQQGAACPSCGRPFDARKKSERIEAVLKDIALAKQQAQKYGEVLSAVNDLRRTLTQQDKDIRERRANAASLAEAHSRLERAGQDAKSALDKVAKAKTVAGAPQDIEEIERRIKRGEEILAQVRGYVAVRQGYDRFSAQAQVVSREFGAMERLVDALGPHGLRSQIAGPGMEGLRNAAVAVAQEFGLRLTFTLDPYLLRLDGRPPEVLSGSERLQCSLAIQVGLARASGLNFLCLDNAEILDTTRRACLHRVMSMGMVDQILAAATLKTPDAQFRPGPVPDGWRFYLVRKEDGVSVMEGIS